MLALIEAVFKRPIQDRVALPFSIIAKEAQVPVDEVEHLVMKALMCVAPASRSGRFSRLSSETVLTETGSLRYAGST